MVNEEIEFIPVQIPCAVYEKQILKLIETLLEVDERLFKDQIEENTKPGESPPEVAV